MVCEVISAQVLYRLCNYIWRRIESNARHPSSVRANMFDLSNKRHKGCVKNGSFVLITASITDYFQCSGCSFIVHRSIANESHADDGETLVYKPDPITKRYHTGLVPTSEAHLYEKFKP